MKISDLVKCGAVEGIAKMSSVGGNKWSDVFNSAREELYAQEVDLSKVLDKEKIKELMSECETEKHCDCGSRFSINRSKLATAIVDKANELGRV